MAIFPDISKKMAGIGGIPLNSREWWMVQYRGMARSCFGINKTFKTVSFQHHLFTKRHAVVVVG